MQRLFKLPVVLTVTVLLTLAATSIGLSPWGREPGGPGSRDSDPASVRADQNLAARIDDRLVGYLVCSRYDQVWHLMNVAVAPEHRRAGVARQLIGRLFEEAGDGLPFTLEVRVSNREAIVMYERFGFRSAGRRRGYYHDNGEDAVIMWFESEAEQVSVSA